jgi:calcineurin-like phosphoesterase family protein
MDTNLYWISDTHWQHTNIINYSGRPFRKSFYPYAPDVDQMNRELIQQWNAVVKPLDRVIHGGDFAMGQKKMIPFFRSKLNGHITLVRGNHDPSTQFMKQAGFDEVVDELWLELNDMKIWVRHIPPTPEEISKLHRPVDLVICGHVHEAWAEKNIQGKRVINMGVDAGRGYAPKTLDELLVPVVPKLVVTT